MLVDQVAVETGSSVQPCCISREGSDPKPWLSTAKTGSVALMGKTAHRKKSDCYLREVA